MDVNCTLLDDVEATFRWVTCRVPLEAVTVQFPPDVAWPVEILGNSCLSSPPAIWTITECGNRTVLIYSGPIAMTAAWAAGSVAPKTMTKHPWLPNSETWHWWYYDISLQQAVQMVWACIACNVLLQIWHRLPPESEGGLDAWSQCVTHNFRWYSLSGVYMQDNDAWRFSVRWCVVLPIPSNFIRRAPHLKMDMGRWMA